MHWQPLQSASRQEFSSLILRIYFRATISAYEGFAFLIESWISK